MVPRKIISTCKNVVYEASNDILMMCKVDKTYKKNPDKTYNEFKIQIYYH